MVRPFVVGLGLLAGLAVIGCANGTSRDLPTTEESLHDVSPADAAVRTGADVLAAEGFARLAGRRVGLIANHTSRTDTAHLGDLLAAAPEVELVALFGPEHGVRGTSEAGAEVRGGVDVRTGVPVYSLYGATNKPTPEMLRGIDVLLFDVQDVGARFYTYISTMGLAMQAAAEAGIPFLVLDRPNPLGGEYVSGFVMEPPQESFVGLFPIPIAHGLTVGELARMIKGEAMLDGLGDLDLQVVPMEGWKRSMLWPETGLRWIPPSPNLPRFESALVYPGTCLFEALVASEGRGTDDPFLQVAAPYVDGRATAQDLNDRYLPGVQFRAVSFTPRSIEGMSANPRFRGREVQGVALEVSDAAAFQPVETGIHLIDAFRRQAQASGAELIDRAEWLAKLAGTERLARMLSSGDSPAQIIESWQRDVDRFREKREAYLLYE
ncbi:MAG TPA: DUF1343 domain-containing protein [Rhodothermales bacterium]